VYIVRAAVVVSIGIVQVELAGEYEIVSDDGER
jgi:hypothetical protein